MSLIRAALQTTTPLFVIFSGLASEAQSVEVSPAAAPHSASLTAAQQLVEQAAAQLPTAWPPAPTGTAQLPSPNNEVAKLMRRFSNELQARAKNKLASRSDLNAAQLGLTAAQADADANRDCADKAILTMKINLISSNIANLGSTRTPEGGPYRAYELLKCGRGDQPADCQPTRTTASPIEKYEPDHPDADDNGYVAYPNINLTEQMQNMIDVSRELETVIADCDRSSALLRQKLE